MILPIIAMPTRFAVGQNVKAVCNIYNPLIVDLTIPESVPATPHAKLGSAGVVTEVLFAEELFPMYIVGFDGQELIVEAEEIELAMEATDEN